MRVTASVMRLIPVLLTACAATPPTPEVFIKAAPVAEQNTTPAVVTVPKVMPMPGQLKPLEAVAPPEAKRDGKTVGEVIDAGNQAARVKPASDQFFNAMTRYDYEPGALYQIYTAPKRFTDIMLAPGETLTGKPAGGDTVRWELGVTASGEAPLQRVHILVKPTRPGLTTNLALHTNRRTYLLELHSFQQSYMASVSWHYPYETLQQLQRSVVAEQRQRDQVIAQWSSPTELHFDYRVETHRGKTPAWLPVRVFDDGRKTYIQFPRDIAAREAPALFILSAQQHTQLVNYRVKGEYYIVDRLFDQAELRVGEKRQSIVRLYRRERPNKATNNTRRAER